MSRSNPVSLANQTSSLFFGSGTNLPSWLDDGDDFGPPDALSSGPQKPSARKTSGPHLPAPNSLKHPRSESENIPPKMSPFRANKLPSLAACSPQSCAAGPAVAVSVQERRLHGTHTVNSGQPQQAQGQGQDESPTAPHPPASPESGRHLRPARRSSAQAPSSLLSGPPQAQAQTQAQPQAQPPPTMPHPTSYAATGTAPHSPPAPSRDQPLQDQPGPGAGVLPTKPRSQSLAQSTPLCGQPRAWPHRHQLHPPAQLQPHQPAPSAWSGITTPFQTPPSASMQPAQSPVVPAFTAAGASTPVTAPVSGLAPAPVDVIVLDSSDDESPPNQGSEARPAHIPPSPAPSSGPGTIPLHTAASPALGHHRYGVVPTAVLGTQSNPHTPSPLSGPQPSFWAPAPHTAFANNPVPPTSQSGRPQQLSSQPLPLVPTPVPAPQHIPGPALGPDAGPPRPPPGPEPPVSYFTKEFLQAKFDRLLLDLTRATGPLQPAERGRLGLLSQAVEVTDCLFITLHMVLCHVLAFPTIPIHPHLGLTQQDFQRAAEIFFTLLAPAGVVSRAHVAGLGTFPFGIAPEMRLYLMDVGALMRGMVAKWPDFVMSTSARASPPSCVSIHLDMPPLQVCAPSAIILRLIFTFLLRLAWGVNCPPHLLAAGEEVCNSSITNTFTLLLSTPESQKELVMGLFEKQFNARMASLYCEVMAALTPAQKRQLVAYRQNFQKTLGLGVLGQHRQQISHVLLQSHNPPAPPAPQPAGPRQTTFSVHQGVTTLARPSAQTHPPNGPVRAATAATTTPTAQAQPRPQQAQLSHFWPNSGHSPAVGTSPSALQQSQPSQQRAAQHQHLQNRPQLQPQSQPRNGQSEGAAAAQAVMTRPTEPPDNALLMSRTPAVRMLAIANPTRTALHQAGQTSPLLLPVMPPAQAGSPLPQADCFQFVSAVLVNPLPLLSPDPQTLSSAEVIEFSLSESSTRLLARDISPPPSLAPKLGDKLTVRLLDERYSQIRLRLLPFPTKELPQYEAKHREKSLDLSEILACSSVWPTGVSITVNGTTLPVRRKLHWGQDRPLDISNHLRTGNNKIEILVPPPVIDEKGHRQATLDDTQCYRVSLEQVRIMSRQSIVGTVLSQHALIRPSLDIISHHFEPAKAKSKSSSRHSHIQTPKADDHGSGDESEHEIEFLSTLSPINLALVDPITFSSARLRAGIPVRTRGCVTHLQAFELSTFLDSVASISAAPIRPLDPAQQGTESQRYDRWTHKGMVWMNSQDLLLLRKCASDAANQNPQKAASSLSPASSTTPARDSVASSVPLPPRDGPVQATARSPDTAVSQGMEASLPDITIPSDHDFAWPVFPPSAPDNWRCPICSADARPDKLFVDGYVLSILSDMERRAKEREKISEWNAKLLAESLITEPEPLPSLVAPRDEQAEQLARLRDDAETIAIDDDDDGPDPSPGSPTKSLFPRLGQLAIDHPWCAVRAEGVAKGWVGADLMDILSPGLIGGLESLEMGGGGGTTSSGDANRNSNTSAGASGNGATRAQQAQPESRPSRRARLVVGDDNDENEAEEDNSLEPGEIVEIVSSTGSDGADRPGPGARTGSGREDPTRSGVASSNGRTIDRDINAATATATPGGGGAAAAGPQTVPKPRSFWDDDDDDDLDGEDDDMPDAVVVQEDGTWSIA